MHRTAVALMLAAGLSTPGSVRALTSRQVRGAMGRGIEHLRRSQLPGGSWSGLAAYHGGTTALATLALLTAGLPPTDRTVAAGLRGLRTLNSGKTYVISLQIMALAMGEPERDKRRIRELAKRLAGGQFQHGRYMGMWGYDVNRRGRADNSNTQFALLGLKAAGDAGVKVPQGVWKQSLKHWITNQNRDGGWGYGSGGAHGSMTCAGVAGLIICGASLESTRARWLRGHVIDCGKYSHNLPLARGIIWLSRNFSVATHPRKGGWYHYYM